MKGFVYLLEIAIVAILVTVVLSMFFSVRVKQNWEKSDLISTGYNMLNYIKQDNNSLINILNENMTKIDALRTKNMKYNLQVIGVPKSNIEVGCGPVSSCYLIKSLLTPTYVNNHWINFTVTDIDLNAPEFPDFDAIILYGLGNYSKQKDKINNYLNKGGVLLGINDTFGDKSSQEAKDFYEIFNSSDPFSDGFESNDFSMWDSLISNLNSSLEVTTTIPPGSPAAKAVISTPYGRNETHYGGHASFTKDFEDEEEVYTNFSFYLAATPSLNEWKNDSYPIIIASHIKKGIDRANSYYLNSVFLWKRLDPPTDNNIYIGMRVYNGKSTRYTWNFTNTVIDPNAWYNIEFKTLLACGSGVAELWVHKVTDPPNPSPIFSWTDLCNDDGGATTINETRIGLDASPGDITGAYIRDGMIDMMDQFLVGFAYGSNEGEARYVPTADFTGANRWYPDGTVDMKDVNLIASLYGCPKGSLPNPSSNVQAYFDSIYISTQQIVIPTPLGGPFREYETIPKYFLGLGFDIISPHEWMIWGQRWRVMYTDATHVNITNLLGTEFHFVPEGGTFSITSPVDNSDYTFKVRKIFYQDRIFIQPLNTTFPFIDFSGPSCVIGQYNVINRSDGCALMTSNNTAIWMSDFPETDEHRTLVKAAILSRANWFVKKQSTTKDTVTVSSFIPMCCDMPETAELYLTLWYEV